LEKGFLLETLKRNQWNRAATAKQLGIHTSTLWRKMKRLNIVTPKQGNPVRKKDAERIRIA
jgi:transcriptional regulator of acetoin/glycerol metabolism